MKCFTVQFDESSGYDESRKSLFLMSCTPVLGLTLNEFVQPSLNEPLNSWVWTSFG